MWELCYFLVLFSAFVRQKTVIKNVSFTDYASEIQLPDCSKLAINPKNYYDVTIYRHDVTFHFFDIILFFFSSLVTGSGFMSISSLVLELRQFSFIRDWPEIWKSEIPLSEFYPISGDWDELGIPSLARMFLMKCYLMLQIAKVTAFTVSELLRKTNRGRGAGEGGGVKITPTIRVNV